VNREERAALVLMYLYPFDRLAKAAAVRGLLSLGLAESGWTGGRLRENRYRERLTRKGREAAEKEIAAMMTLQGWEWAIALVPPRRSKKMPGPTFRNEK
jgi:hypothetical protein